MAQLGKTTTPTWPTFGWIQATNSQNQVAILQTVPTGGGIFTSVSFWVAGHASNHDTIYGCIWDSSGNLLASGSGVDTTGGNAVDGTPGGPASFYTDTLSSPLYIAGGTQIYIGWHAVNGTTRDWAYNGGDHSPDARSRTSASGTPNTFSGHAAMSPAGTVATYATYTPGSIFADDGAAFQGGCIVYCDDGATWQQCEVYVDDGSAWQRVA